MSLRCYLGGPSVEIGRVLVMAHRLEEAGVTLTERWYNDVISRGGAPDSTLTPHQQRERASACLRGIGAADVVMLLWPDRVSQGTACELGYAIATGKHVIACGPNVRASVFTALAETYDSDMDALRAVLELAAEREPRSVVP